MYGLESFSEGIKNVRQEFQKQQLQLGAKPKSRHFYTKEGFLKSLKNGHLPSGVQYLDEEAGRWMDKYGVVRDNDGPFWPVESVPLFPTPKFKWWTELGEELLYTMLPGE